MPLDLSHSSLREYNVTLSSGEVMYILARSSKTQHGMRRNWPWIGH